MHMTLALVLLASDAGFADWPAPPPPPQASEQSPLDKLNGFQKTTWGMESAKVKKLFPNAQTASKKPGDESLMVPKMTVSNLTGTLGLLFQGANGGLSMVLFMVDDKQKGRSMEQTCDALRSALEEKYGPPVKKEGELKLDGTKYAWMGERTIVGLLCTEFPKSPMTKVSLSYLARAELEKPPPDVKSDDL